MQQSWRRRGVATAVVLATAVFGTVISSPGAQAGPKADPPGLAKGHDKRSVEDVPVSETGSYVVILDEVGLIGEFDRDQLRSPAAEAKGRAIVQGHDRLLDATGIGAGQKLQSYENAISGFAAKMSQPQAQKLADTAGVAMVLPDELQQLTTDASGEFLGLAGDSGVWAQGLTGEDVVIGVIDSGIWPEHPSVADDGSYSDLGLDVPCDFGTTTHELAPGLIDDAFSCNNKLIGARHMMPTYLELTGLTEIEYGSARDESGHGTHTATTAAGNADVAASLFGIDRGSVTGIAPRARVIAYKALGELGGYGSDLAGAIDQAVADGVDVMNYSIGSSSFALGPDDIAFLFAADAGVHVATSNGNSGPGPATTGSPASVPWLTSVGASTHDRTFEGSVIISEGVATPPTSSRKNIPTTEYLGASITESTGRVKIVDAAKHGNELCDPSVPFRGKIAGSIVLCKRGATARVAKSLAVYQAGGVGMVLYNTFDADSEVTDSHWVPSVHINNTDGLALKQLIKSARQPVAQIGGGVAVEIPGSSMAAFSSRGENRYSADIIKPDVTAPGVNILAGNTPTPTTGRPGDLFQSISGTSMSSPHVAGLMALMKQAHPTWSPSAVKSALMTTARQDVTKEDGVTSADPFDMGAGHVDPPSMFEPGLVYEAGFFENLGFLCDADPGQLGPGTCPFLASIGVPTDASQYNQASIAIGALAGSETITRTVRNVTGADITVSASFDGLSGVTASLSPASLTVPAGGEARYEVMFTASSAPADLWTFGSMTLSGDGYSVYSPVALRPVTIGVPAAVTATISDGGTSFDVSFGYTGPYTAAAHGLEAATVYNSTVGQDDDQTFDPSDAGVGAIAHTVDVAGAALLRVTIPPISGLPDTDLDLFVFDPDGNLAGVSVNGGTDEVVDILMPADGTWTFYVHGWGVGVPGDTVDYEANSWVISATPGGNMNIASAPASATLGAIETITVTWPSDLEPAHYLGAVSHADGAGVVGLTLVDVTG